VKSGKKAVEADKPINKKIPAEEQNKQQQQDAQSWRNEV